MERQKTFVALNKAGKIISKVFLIIGIVGAALCVFGIIGLAVIPDGIIIDGVNIRAFIQSKTNMSYETMYAAMGIGLLDLIAEIVLCAYSVRYFDSVISVGDPFNDDVAKRTLNYGIFIFVTAIITSFLSSVGLEVVRQFVANISLTETSSGAENLTVGVMFLFISAVYYLGAEKLNKNRETDVSAEEPFDDPFDNDRTEIK